MLASQWSILERTNPVVNPVVASQKYLLKVHLKSGNEKTILHYFVLILVVHSSLYNHVGSLINQYRFVQFISLQLSLFRASLKYSAPSSFNSLKLMFNLISLQLSLFRA